MQILEIFSTHIGSKAANQSPLLANKNYLRGIHIEHEFIILEFLCFSALRSQLQIYIQIVSRSSDQCFPIQIVLRSPLQIFVFLLRICVFQIVISKPCLLLPSDLVFSSSFGSSSLVLQIVPSSSFGYSFFKYFSSLRNLSSTWINYSISTPELESLRLDFVTELEFQRLEMLVC